MNYRQYLIRASLVFSIVLSTSSSAAGWVHETLQDPFTDEIVHLLVSQADQHNASFVWVCPKNGTHYHFLYDPADRISQGVREGEEVWLAYRIDSEEPQNFSVRPENHNGYVIFNGQGWRLLQRLWERMENGTERMAVAIRVGEQRRYVSIFDLAGFAEVGQTFRQNCGQF